MKFITEHPNWYEFTKRLPRTFPRYLGEQRPNPLMSWPGLGMAATTPEYMASIQQQLVAMRYVPQQYGPSVFGGLFGGFYQ